MHACVLHMCLRLDTKQKKLSDPLELKLQMAVTTRWCWESNLGPLVEWLVFSTDKLSLQSQSLISEN